MGILHFGSGDRAGRRLLLACPFGLALAVTLLCVSCGGEPQAQSGTQPQHPTTSSNTSVVVTTQPPETQGAATCWTTAYTWARRGLGGVVVGLVFKQPVTLEEARALDADLQGDLIAVYRTDYGCAREDTHGTGTATHVPSRFSYVDAFQYQERELAESGRTPIADWDAARSAWLHWEDQWRHVQEPGVRFEAAAVYVLESALPGIRSDPRFRAVEILPHRVVDGGNLGPNVLLESEDLPPGLLTELPPPECSATLSPDAELEAFDAALKSESPQVGWAELLKRAKGVGAQKVVGVLREEEIGQPANGTPPPPSGSGILYVDGDPGQRLTLFFDFDLMSGEDPRYQNLWNRAGDGFKNLDLHAGTLAAWGYPVNLGGTELFHVIAFEYQ